MSSIIHKVKDAVSGHSDKSHESSHSSNTTSTTQHPHSTTGHSSHEPMSTTGTGANAYDSTHSSNHGPHQSNVANKADPRVDSDRDGRAAYGHNATSSGMNTHHTTTGTGAGAGLAGVGHSSHEPMSTAGTGVNAYDSTHSSNHGPHQSNVANKADPRVDSDRDGRAAYGHNSTSSGMNTHSTTTGAGAGLAGAGLAGAGHSSHGAGHSSHEPLGTGAGANTYNSTHSSSHGPHQSNVANKVDPRVDSDRDGRAAYGHNSTSSGLNSHHTATGAGVGAGAGLATGAAAHELGSSHSANVGPHHSNAANKMDPRVDSDLDGRASHSTNTYNTNAPGTTVGSGGVGHTGPATGSGAHTGLTGHHSTMGDMNQASATNSYATGPADSTAGPHKSNIANKADPRVDSDLSNETNRESGQRMGTSNFHNDVHKGSIGGAGVIPISGNAGPTSTKTFEEAQETGATGAGSSYNTSHHTTTGHGNKTAGPHKSDMANKLDPRVDSDLDGSKTIGGSQRV
ncbi:hypothetical protein PDE_07727 [Penicillium oxalicum 114-2]|uniref:Uncharacterized protein n=1 Tax=Penicillium oxalicum (strain 114-2 / CGMCC 5302) TaxID=933388 RepID=S8BCU6_PENO1|nr:hypothetical protein PDE_07727 [Penicillium oxalicum 114-2]